jgi:hypothetical protein
MRPSPTQLLVGSYAITGIYSGSMTHDEKPLIWMGSSRKDLGTMPRAVQREFGFALHDDWRKEFEDDPKDQETGYRLQAQFR